MDKNRFLVDNADHPLLDNQTFKSLLAQTEPEFQHGYADMVFNAEAPYANVLPYFSSQSTLGVAPEAERTTFGKKFQASAALENVTGRAVWNLDRYVINPLLSGDEPELQFYDPATKTLTTEFDVHDYVRKNEADLAKTEDGKVILKNYSLGYYDGMSSNAFFRAVGYDITEHSLRKDLYASTGSGIVDFAAVAAGSSLDPTTFIGGKIAVNLGETALAYKKLKNIEQAWQRTRAYRNIVANNKLGAKAFVIEEAKQGFAAGVFSQAMLQALDDERELDSFATDVAAMTLGQIAFSSAMRGAGVGVRKLTGTDIAGRPPLSPKDIDAYVDNAMKARTKVEAAIKQEFDAHAEAEPTPLEDIEFARVETELNKPADMAEAEVRIASEEAAKFNRDAEQGTFSFAQDVQQTIDEVAMYEKDIAEDLAKLSAKHPDKGDIQSLMDAVTNDVLKGDEEIAATVDRLTVNASKVDDAKIADLVDNLLDELQRPKASEGRFSPEELSLLRQILDNQNRVMETPIDVEAAVKQLDAIASRGTQLFNYGRLDAMGLRTVKIDQPVSVIAQRIIDRGGELNLEQALAELKKMTPEQQADVYSSDAKLNSTLQALTQLLGNRNAAASVMTEIGQGIADMSKEGIMSKGLRGRITKPLRTTANRSVRSGVEDFSDYMPDRSNDVVNKFVVKVRQATEKMIGKENARSLAKTPVLGRFIGGDNVNPEVMGQFAIHDHFSYRKYLLSDNPIIAAVSNTLFTRLLPMKGQTAGRINSKFSVDKMAKTIRGRVNLAQAVVLHEFEAFRKAAGLDFAMLSDKAVVKSEQYYLLSQKYMKTFDRFNNSMERLRMMAIDASTPEGDAALKEAARALTFDYWDGFADVETALVQSYKRLAEVGLTQQATPGKTTKWMTADQLSILKGVTSVELHPDKLTLEQLDNMMRTFFLSTLDSKPDIQSSSGKLKAAMTEAMRKVDTTAKEYKGLEVFAQSEEIDVDTGQRIKRFGIITKDEIRAASTDPIKAKQLVNKVAREFNDNWGGLVPIRRIEQYMKVVDPAIGTSGGVTFDISRTLQKVGRFIEKHELATQLASRLREFEKLKLKDTYSAADLDLIRKGEMDAETIFTPLIRQYEDMQLSLKQAIRNEVLMNVEEPLFKDATLGNDAQILSTATPRTFHYYTEFSKNALNKAKDYAVEVGQKLGIDDNISRARADEMAKLFSEYFGLEANPAPSVAGKVVVDTTRNFILGSVGFTQTIDLLGKSVAQSITNADLRGWQSFFNTLESTLFSAKKAGLNSNDMGYALESLSAHLEDVSNVALNRLDDVAGNQYLNIGPETNWEKVTSAHRAIMGKLSLIGFVNDVMMSSNAKTANTLLGGVKGNGGLVELAAKTVRLMREKNIPANVAAKELRNVAGFDVNTFHAVSKIMANVSHDDILGMDDVLKAVEWKQVNSYARGTNSAKSWVEVPNGTNLTELQANYLRKYGQLIDYWMTDELANVPSGSASITIASPHSFIHKMMTMFLRPAIQALNGMGISQSNVGMSQRGLMAAYMTAVAMSIMALRAYSNGGAAWERWKRQTEEPQGILQLVSQGLEYSGFLGIVLSRAGNQFLEMTSSSPFAYQNAGEFQVMSPVQSLYLQFSRGVGGAAIAKAKGESLTAQQRSAIRKYLMLNLFETTVGTPVRRGIRTLVDEDIIENETASDTVRWLVPRTGER